jgi:hypothetical protein
MLTLIHNPPTKRSDCALSRFEFLQELGLRHALDLTGAESTSKRVLVNLPVSSTVSGDKTPLRLPG